MKKYIKKKSLICLLVCFIAVIFMVGCSNNNKSVVGNWYIVSIGEYTFDPEAYNGMKGLELYEDGTFYDSFVEGEGTYKVKGNSVIATYLHLNDNTKVECVISETEGYTCLTADYQDYGYSDIPFTLVKGEDDALEYISGVKSDIWAYDFAGDYYRAEDDELSHLSEYDQMVEMKLAGGGYTVFGSFSLSDDYSGYEHTRYGSSYALTVDLDRENKTMVLIGPDGYATDYTIEWCEEIQEWVFYSGSDYYCKLDNVE